MPEVIINGSGPQYPLVVNSDGSINVVSSGASSGVGSVYIVNDIIHTLGTQHVDADLAMDVHAVLSAKMPNGSYTNIDATAGGNLKVSVEDWNGVVGSVYTIGVNSNDIVRKAVGSPGVWFVLGGLSQSVFIENLSTTNPLYFNFTGVATAGSTSGFLGAGENIALDLRVGSLNLMGSGTSTDNAQVIGIR